MRPATREKEWTTRRNRRVSGFDLTGLVVITTVRREGSRLTGEIDSKGNGER
jgi:hypothetical protein